MLVMLLIVLGVEEIGLEVFALSYDGNDGVVYLFVVDCHHHYHSHFAVQAI